MRLRARRLVMSLGQVPLWKPSKGECGQVGLPFGRAFPLLAGIALFVGVRQPHDLVAQHLTSNIKS